MKFKGRPKKSDDESYLFNKYDYIRDLLPLFMLIVIRQSKGQLNGFKLKKDIETIAAQHLKLKNFSITHHLLYETLDTMTAASQDRLPLILADEDAHGYTITASGKSAITDWLNFAKGAISIAEQLNEEGGIDNE